ncbi:unnamed protein product [marine sediment metagenome]|uniref:Uncharacterized protein n=1 Tax=marine sediment metagenome TaxID=412755 RepID=X0XMS6_9ZZZZ
MSEKPRKPLCFDCKFGRCSLIQSTQVISENELKAFMAGPPDQKKEDWQIDDDEEDANKTPQEVSVYITHCYWQPPGMDCKNMEGPSDVPDVVECNQFEPKE